MLRRTMTVSAGIPSSARRLRPASSAVALVVGIVVVALLIADIPLDTLTRNFAGGTEVLPFLPFACVGLVVAHRQPRNPIGWLLLAVGVGTAVAYAAGPYAVFAFRDGHSALPLARLASVLTGGWILFVVLLPLPILLFPDGQLPSRRWRWPLGAYVLLAATVVVVVVGGDAPALSIRHVHVDSLGELTGANNASDSKHGSVITVLFAGMYVALSLSFIVRRVLGFRHSVGVHRQQLKWLLSGSVLAIAGAIATVTLNRSGPVADAIGAGGYLAVAALPVAIGIGVLRYRLYEIDRLVSRTLSYAILTGLLVGTFVALVALTTDTLALSGRVGVAASTLIAAALFNPLRIRIQRTVDRRFNRARYNAEATVAAFTARLGDAVEIDAIRTELLEVVHQAVQPSHASIWIRP